MSNPIISQVRLAIPPPGMCPHYWAHQEAMRLFAPGPDANRDFLYRLDADCLTALRPAGSSIREDNLVLPYRWPATAEERRFRLRANPTVTKFINGKSRRCDVAQCARNTAEQQERYADWLRRQGERHGFRPGEGGEAIRKYWRVRDGKREMSLVVVDFSGELEVTDAAAFRAGVVQGFGHGKAWGLGLLLC